MLVVMVLIVVLMVLLVCLEELRCAWLQLLRNTYTCVANRV
jgi:hypothetical protein